MKILAGLRSMWWKFLLLVVVSLSGVSLAAQETRKAISQPAPVYPEMGRQFHVAGTVKVQVTIAADGQVKDTKVLGGHPLLVEAAVSALKRWKFAPANAESTQTVEFNFKP